MFPNFSSFQLSKFGLISLNTCSNYRRWMKDYFNWLTVELTVELGVAAVVVVVVQSNIILIVRMNESKGEGQRWATSCKRKLILKCYGPREWVERKSFLTAMGQRWPRWPRCHRQWRQRWLTAASSIHRRRRRRCCCWGLPLDGHTRGCGCPLKFNDLGGVKGHLKLMKRRNWVRFFWVNDGDVSAVNWSADNNNSNNNSSNNINYWPISRSELKWIQIKNY